MKYAVISLFVITSLFIACNSLAAGQEKPSYNPTFFQFNEKDAKVTLEALRRIRTPQVVGIPPVNASRDLMIMPDGEIRHYGFQGGFVKGAGQVQPVYISSRDCGLSWREVLITGPTVGAMVRSPWSGDFLTVLCKTGRSNSDEWHTANQSCEGTGFFVHRSTRGPDGPFSSSLINRHTGFMARQPLPLRQRKRWVLPMQQQVEKRQHPGVMLSDDDGLTWREVILPSPPPHKIEWPHAGVRWQNYGCEPTVVELSDGKLWMLIRTSQDCHYEAFSSDGGESWTTPAPSRFYATITMPLLFRMNDGRLLVVWNNSTPLPELDHNAQPELNRSEREGTSEDFFTNRDVIHAAISKDDGKTWRGFRELYLNERRNDHDFRSSGGNASCLDKSVHQSQALELPEGKILLAFGQHPLCRKLIIFDPDWLLENHRKDDFSLGLGGWSVQQYLKSIAGNFRGISGHCAYNRRAGASLIPHPDGLPREVLQVARHPDTRLVHEIEGAVWNFPCGKRGSLKIRIRMPKGSQGIQVCLVDRWFNPVDPVVSHFAQHVLRIDSAGRINTIQCLNPDTWADLEIRWDTDTARFSVTGETWHKLPLVFPTRNGISYLHLQSIAAESDIYGTLIESVSASVEE
ncbi:MAG: sialidase family protein [Kiritimatiellae bacterium]|nr:sialidase family protein [Kiritimatiellia bacterium]MDD5523095.1 sialidase family protein [Kiritimatiellia bacterium]